MAAEPKLVVVATYDSEIEAELARGLLESGGVTAFVVRENVGGWYAGVAGLFGVKLLVPEDELEAAREILDMPESDKDG